MSFFKDSNENSDWWHERDYKKRFKPKPKKEKSISYDELYDLAYAANAGKTTLEDNKRLIKMFNEYFKN